VPEARTCVVCETGRFGASSWSGSRVAQMTVAGGGEASCRSLARRQWQHGCETVTGCGCLDGSQRSGDVAGLVD